MFAHFEQVVRKAMVSSVDEAVGNIIETLEATGAVQGHLAIVNALATKMTITQAKWQHKCIMPVVSFEPNCSLKRRPTIEFAAYSDTYILALQFSLKTHKQIKLFF